MNLNKVRSVVCRQLSQLAYHYGVKADVYFPKSYSDGFSGANSKSISYGSTPDLENFLVIPPTMTTDESFKFDFIDNLFDDDFKRLYVPCTYKSVLPNDSKVVVNSEDGTKTILKINNKRDFIINGSIVLVYYTVVQIISESGRSDMSEHDVSMDTIPKSSSSNIDKISVDKVLSEEDKDKLYNKRRINKFSVEE